MTAFSLTICARPACECEKWPRFQLAGQGPGSPGLRGREGILEAMSGLEKAQMGFDGSGASCSSG